MELVCANNFSLEQLTEAYNQTRIDYIVPMPLNAARLREYIDIYDVDLRSSWVAVHGETIFGLGMLGVRRDRAWITRVGVLPKGRRQGTGRAIIDRLLQSAVDKGIGAIWLEVIAGNLPANQLFLTSGFKRTRKLVVARRPPTHIDKAPLSNTGSVAPKQITKLNNDQVLSFARERNTRPNWLNETESLVNVPGYQGILIEFENGSKGWVGYKVDQFQLTHIECVCLTGSQDSVTAGLLRTLHHLHQSQDAILQNLPSSDLRWRGYKSAGYFDVFRRIEMVRILA